jgi:hypothetical protein
MATCIVSFLDAQGFRHAVEVQAESLYEAGVLALRTFKHHNCEPGIGSQLEIEVRSSVKHIITPMKIHEWLSAGSRSPKEAVSKDRLRALLR